MTVDEACRRAIPRCTCATVDDEPVPGVPGQWRCKICKNWTVLAITTAEEYAAFSKWMANG